MKRITLIIFIACVLAVSCNKEDGIWGRHGNSACINVNISGITNLATRAGSAGGQLFDSFAIDTIDGQELRVDAYVSDFNPEECGEQTKGTIITTANIDKFWMDAYANDEWHDHVTDTDHDAGLYYDKKAVTKSSGGWSIADSPKWINDVELTFWSWYTGLYSDSGETPVPVSGADNKATINITNNGNSDLIYAFNREKRTFDDKTGEITGGTGTYNANYNDAMNIRFYHALAAVRFDISGLKNKGLTIKEIAIKDVANEADCYIEGLEDDDRTVKFDWVNFDGKATFEKSFNASDFTETGEDGTTPAALMPMSSSKFLFLIPQTVEGQGITIELVYEDASGTEVTKTASLNHSEKWVAGKYYTYALNKNDDNLCLELLEEGGVLKTSAADAHFENAILKFSKTAPDSYSLEIVKPDGTTSTAAADAAWLSFARPASATAFASYPGASATVGIADLMAELKGTGDKPHFLSYGGYYYTQAFINEYYYSGQSLASFVNKNDRSVKITISKGDKEASATIAQHSIKSPYDLSSSNPLGVEMIEESDVASGTDPCADRNRGSSGPWRQPSLQEYYYLWYGNNTLVNAGWTALSDAGYATTDNGVKGRYDGVASTWGILPGTGRVRCVRDLGNGAPSPMYSINSPDRIVTMQNVGAGSLRTTAKTGEYPAHTVTDDANLLPAKFKVAENPMKYSTGVSFVTEQFELGVEYINTVPITVTETSNSIYHVTGRLHFLFYMEDIWFKCEYIGGKGGPKNGVNSNTMTIDADGYADFDLVSTTWNAGSNSYLSWSIQAMYGNTPIGNPSYLYLSMGSQPTYGALDNVSNSGAIVVNNSSSWVKYGKNYWYFAFKTGTSSNKPVVQYSYDHTATILTQNDPCANYHEGIRIVDMKNQTESYDDQGKWRAPNQRELSIMLLESSNLGIDLISFAEPYYSSRTTYNSAPYYYYGGSMTTSDGASEVNGKFKIRCVRDID